MPHALKSAPDIRAVSASLPPPFVHLVVQRLSRAVSGRGLDRAPPLKWNHHSYPRGPRSCPGYVVPDHHHLIDPIRPTRRHIAISPRSGLYAMPSLCGSAEATREWFRAFAAHSFLTCRPLRPRGVRTSYRPSSRRRHGLRHELTGSTLPMLPRSVSRGRSLSRLHWFTTVAACQVARLP